MPFGASGVRSCAEPAETKLLKGFPHEPWLSADERTTPDSTRFRGSDMSVFGL